MKNIPNPGSKEAQKQGCKCPVIDNHYGKGFPYPGVKGPAFYISSVCPIHANNPTDESKKENLKGE